MICCDKCACWQHNECMEISQDQDALPETYLCELCSPTDHEGLLEKIARGEKPWEARARERESGKRGKKKKGKGGKKARRSDVPEEVNGKHGRAEAPEAKPEDVEMGPPTGRRASGAKRKSRGEASDAGEGVEAEVEKVRPLAAQ